MFFEFFLVIYFLPHNLNVLFCMENKYLFQLSVIIFKLIPFAFCLLQYTTLHRIYSDLMFYTTSWRQKEQAKELLRWSLITMEEDSEHEMVGRITFSLPVFFPFMLPMTGL